MRNERGGISFESIFQAIRGTRTNLQPSVRKMLAVYGDIPIDNMIVMRTPLSSFQNTLLTIIRGGKPSHDQLFHLGLVLGYQDGTKLLLHKTEQPNVDRYVQQKNTEYLPIEIPRRITLKELIGNAIDRFGNDRIVHYGAYNYNCQRFVMDVLLASGFSVDQDLNDFILQDVSNLVSSFGMRLTDLATDFKNRLNLALRGYGNLKLIRGVPGLVRGGYKFYLIN